MLKTSASSPSDVRSDALLPLKLRVSHSQSVKCGDYNAAAVVVSQPKVEDVKRRLAALAALLSAERRLLKDRRRDIDTLETEVRGVDRQVLMSSASQPRCAVVGSIV